VADGPPTNPSDSINLDWGNTTRGFLKFNARLRIPLGPVDEIAEAEIFRIPARSEA
jgi:hypothetical protein